MMRIYWIFRWKRMKLDPLLTLYTKINSAWNKDFGVSMKAITLLENMDINLCDLGVSNGFRYDTKAHTIKENREIGLYQNTKILCIKGRYQENEKTHRMGKVFANHITGKVQIQNLPRLL